MIASLRSATSQVVIQGIFSTMSIHSRVSGVMFREPKIGTANHVWLATVYGTGGAISPARTAGLRAPRPYSPPSSKSFPPRIISMGSLRTKLQSQPLLTTSSVALKPFTPG